LRRATVYIYKICISLSNNYDHEISTVCVAAKIPHTFVLTFWRIQSDKAQGVTFHIRVIFNFTISLSCV